MADDGKRISLFNDRTTLPVHRPFTEAERAIMVEELTIFGACDEGFRRVALRCGRHMYECRHEHRLMLGVKTNLVMHTRSRRPEEGRGHRKQPKGALAVEE